MPALAPSVSVVLPTHDRRGTLGAAIDSVLSQTWADLELIVVDDGSRDGTPELLATVDDARVRVRRLPRRSGAPVARNLGISLARGRYVAFQDSDDVWRPDALGAQVAALDSADEDVAVVYGAILRHQGGRSLRIPGPGHPGPTADLPAHLAAENFVDLPAALVRAEALRAVGGFDPELPRFQDWDLWLRLARSFRFRFVDEVLLDSYDSPVSISRDEDAYFRAMEVILARHAEVFARAPEAALHHHLRLVAVGLLRRRSLPYGTHLRAARASLGWAPLRSVGTRVLAGGYRRARALA